MFSCYDLGACGYLPIHTHELSARISIVIHIRYFDSISFQRTHQDHTQQPLEEVYQVSASGVKCNIGSTF